MQIFLEAVDVWLFRDGRPFDARSDHRARSLFPPYPSVVQGAIRSHHLVVNKVDLSKPKAQLQAHIKELVGDNEDFKGLRLRGPFIAKRVSDGTLIRYFPVPADVAPDEKGYRPLRPRQRSAVPEVLTGAPPDLPMLLWPPEDSKPTMEEHGQWLDGITLLRCLNGDVVKGVNSSELFARENRFGIGRNDERRTTEEGALYEVEFIRPWKNIGLWVQVEGYDGWPDSGLMRIGGEGRGAYFTKVEIASPFKWPAVGDTLLPSFKVYFATPTYFSGGWRPTGGWGEFFDGQVKLQAAALNRYESIGGFDWASGQQKAARRYVPAGSVYYFQHDGSAKLKQDAITEYGAEIGFGQVIVTEWKEWCDV
jgi:CRISPR-associated protein Cmr3